MKRKKKSKLGDNNGGPGEVDTSVLIGQKSEGVSKWCECEYYV